MSSNDAVEQEIRALEGRLLDPDVRQDPRGDLERLLAPDFVEFGASGACYDKRTVIDAVVRSPRMHHRVTAFGIRLLGTGVVLATYVCESSYDGIGGGPQRSLRSSIWELGPDGWRAVFHQGTVTS